LRKAVRAAGASHCAPDDRKAAGHVELDDMIQAGMIGLMDAVNRFEETTGPVRGLRGQPDSRIDA